jgi:tRNA modification GTPase
MVIALVGKPNVGKSSLLNALTGRDRALVHDSPGTTRDMLDVGVEWSGIPVRLVDTAGLRASGADAIEQAGMERTRLEAGAADVLLWVVDVSSPAAEEDVAIAGGLDLSRVVLVLNKSDLGVLSLDWWANNYSLIRQFMVSALSGLGVSELQLSLEKLVGAGCEESGWVANERHARQLVSAREELTRARGVLETSGNLELCAADLGRAVASLAAITGDAVGDDLLDAIFSRFCIGK